MRVTGEPARRRQHLLRSVLLALSWAAPLKADCDPPSKRWIAMQFLDDQDAAFTRAVAADVQAGLAERETDVCPLSAAGHEPPLALIQIEPRGDDSVSVSVDLNEGGRASHVSRKVELAGMPRDSRAFAVALAVNELLGADWAGPAPSETAQPSTFEAAASASPLAMETDAAPTPLPQARNPWRLGVGAAVERFQGGQTHWGGDAGLLVPVHERVGLRVAAGVRQGLETEAPNGRVRSRGLSFTSGARYLLLRAPFELGVSVGAQGEWIQLEGITTDASVSAREFSGFAVYAQAGVSGALRLAGPVWLEAAAAVGVPLRGLEATDEGETATGASGLQLSSSFAVSIEL
jgi:hypothetical protein